LTAPVNTPLLVVDDLTVEFETRRGRIRAVDGVSFSIDAGEVLGLVGESGSGKSVTSLAVTGLTEYTGGTVVRGSVIFDGQDFLALSPGQRADALGRDMGMIFQQPIRSLNPTMRVGDQIAEVAARRPGNGPWRCSTGYRSPMPPAARGSIRTRSAAACPSGP
jgi:peptide/nickel transport system ATP-binding protein